MTKKARLKKKLDKMVKIIVMRDNPLCLVCGKPAITNHHFILKSQSLFLRWKLKNQIPICDECHSEHHYSGDRSIHDTIIRKKGWNWYFDLMSDRHKLFKDTLSNLREVEERLQGGKNEY